MPARTSVETKRHHYRLRSRVTRGGQGSRTLVAANHSTFGERRPVPTGNTLLNDSSAVQTFYGHYTRNEPSAHKYLGNCYQFGSTKGRKLRPRQNLLTD